MVKFKLRVSLLVYSASYSVFTIIKSIRKEKKIHLSYINQKLYLRHLQVKPYPCEKQSEIEELTKLTLIKLQSQQNIEQESYLLKRNVQFSHRNICSSTAGNKHSLYTWTGSHSFVNRLFQLTNLSTSHHLICCDHSFSLCYVTKYIKLHFPKQHTFHESHISIAQFTRITCTSQMPLQYNIFQHQN